MQVAVVAVHILLVVLMREVAVLEVCLVMQVALAQLTEAVEVEVVLVTPQQGKTLLAVMAVLEL
jgi:hypothetical protein